MNHERYERWTPLADVPPRLHLEAMHDDYDGLRFILLGEAGTGPMLRIFFESAIGYRNVNESYRAATWARMPGGGLPSTLLTIVGSSWLRWLVDDAGGVLDGRPLIHYGIYTPEDCVDIVSEFPPIVEWLGAPDAQLNRLA